MINLEKLPQHLSTISENDWNKLFDLLNGIERTDKFGELKGMEKRGDKILSAPYWDSSEIVGKFFDIVNELNIAPVFDWMNSVEGKNILNNPNENYEQLDTITLCKLLTTIIRADRFSDGYLISCFVNGIIPKIILSLKTHLSVTDN